ncbi:DUF6892 domain-containing protein [Sulfitobacter aestuariivivens]|uniref:DUF6892 domain-containing protein n=1 Tax=Sulfitobacter aestuariivivens TaxID=2766981 RepID=UPI0036220847
MGRYPLQQRHLDALTFMELDGGLVIYDYVWPYWDGQSRIFDVSVLDDVRLLPNLERLNVTSMLAGTDLKPLRTARKLERVTLGRIGTWQNLDALLGLPRLTHLSLFKSNLRSRFRNPVLQALRDKGVNVTILR